MSEHKEWATGTDRGAGQAPSLPDLTAVDLRTLRVMDHPELAAAVEHVLVQSLELGESWASNSDGLR
ncbi:hypothetical protein [Streptomyces sp. NPDC046712]|uniref:hypothetical protein n=1 Tax=Streptomyces sp. NPDC046712 TaxID=3154802 RepID=UPI0033CD9747